MAIQITPTEHKAIKKLVDYLEDDERKHWEEGGKPKDHIYNSVKALHSLAKLK